MSRCLPNVHSENICQLWETERLEWMLAGNEWGILPVYLAERCGDRDRNRGVVLSMSE